MSQLWRYEYTFFSGDAARMIGVHRATINRWLNHGILEGRQMPNGHWLIPLKSINDVRELRYDLSRLSKSDADRYFETNEVSV